MLSRILTKAIYDQKRSLIYWNLGTVLLVFLVMTMYPAVQEAGEGFNDLMDALPEEMKALFYGGSSDVGISTPAGWLNIEVYGLMLPFILIIYGIINAVNSIAGEESNGTLELLVTTPISRVQIAIEKFLAILLGMIVISSLYTLTVILFKNSFEMNSLQSSVIISAGFEVFILAIGYMAISYAIGAITGNKGLTLGLSFLITIVSYLWNGFHKFLPDVLESTNNLSLFKYYSSIDTSNTSIDITELLVVSGLSLIIVSISIAIFKNRDLTT